MSPEAETALMQYGLLLGYAALLGAAVVVLIRRPRLRPLVFGVATVALGHTAFYITFLWFPDLLNARETMIFSFVLRYWILGIGALLLLLGVLRDGGRHG